MTIETATKQELNDKFSKRELVEMYNNIIDRFKLDDSKVNSFSGKPTAVDRVFNLIEKVNSNTDMSQPATAEEKPEPKATAKPRTGAVENCKKIFNTFVEKEGYTRGEVLAACEKAGINKKTAATQWQKFRKENNIMTEAKKDGPVAKCREIHAANPTLDRKALVAKMIEAGINKGTASVQASKLLKAAAPAAE